MSYSDRSSLCSPGSNFQGRVRAAALDFAVAVTAESSGTANHATRQLYADMVFSDATGSICLNLGWLASADGTADASDDPTLIARVAAVWSTAASLATRQSLTGGSSSS